jgi:hypothetical protein
MSDRALVLDVQQNRDQVIVGIEAALSAVNSKLRTAFASAGVEERDNVRYTMWSDYSSDEFWLRLTDDSQISALYLELVGPDDFHLGVLEEAVKNEVRTFSCGELKALASSGTVLGVVAWLGIACRGHYDPEVADLIRQALASDDPKIRNNGHLATFMLKWKPLLPSIETALQSETVADLKRGLEYLVEELRGL